SGEATETLIALKLSGFLGFSNKLKRSSIKGLPPVIAMRPHWGHLLLFFNQIDIQSQALEFLDHNVEGFRQPRLEQIVAFYNGLVHAGSTDNIVGLNGQHLLQSVRRTICFQCPDFHLAEALTAKLRLSAEWLLRNQRVRSGGTRVNFVVDKVMKFHDVHNAYRHFAVERFTCLTIVKRDRKSTRLNSSHVAISYAVFCLKKKKNNNT